MKNLVLASSLFLGTAVPAFADDWQQTATPIGPVLVKKVAMFTIAAPLQYQVRLEPLFDATRLGCPKIKDELASLKDFMAACADRAEESATCSAKGALLRLQNELSNPVVFKSLVLSPGANARTGIADALGVSDVELIIPENKMTEAHDLTLQPTSGSDFEKVILAFTAEGFTRFEATPEKVEVDNKLVACSMLNGDAKITGNVHVSGAIERSDDYKNIADIQRLASMLQNKMDIVENQKDPFAKGIAVGALVAEWHSREPTALRLQYLLDLMTVDSFSNITLRDVSSFSSAADVLKTPHTFDIGVMPYIQGVPQ